MAKVQNFSEISPNLPFTEFDFYDLYRNTFEKSDLGRIRQKLPLHEMAENLGLKNSTRPKRGRRILLHAGGQGCADVPEDVHRPERPETNGAAER
ncbi:MAG: hypothetical protein NC115_10640 [Bacteroidales bacterium]|nr:hypothetical protein [Bacteroides sp.]MCM1503103.1 hypothetical protein [Bacteroidales bacterium]